MEITIHEKKYMKFVPNQLNLPVFLASRNRFKTNITPLRHYINHKRQSYTNRCDEENAKKSATFKKYRHIFGLEIEPPSDSCPSKPILNLAKRDMAKRSPWILAPNLYKTEKVPFESRKGTAGAHWDKKHKSHSIKKVEHKSHWKFYDIDNIEMNKCLRYKNIFGTNARKNRATARFMISDLTSCYRNPDDPAPSSYFPQNHTIVHNVSPPVIAKPLNPHTFLRRSCVPEKETYMSTKCRFDPGPGRYDIRYPNFCPCTWKLVILPNLDIIIERQKRLKFRRRPYTKISARHYCSPDWRHVEGRGHIHLFKLPRKQLEKLTAKKRRERKMRKSKDSTKEARDFKSPIKLYADARYLGMINDPNRPKISFRQEFKRPTPKIFFNCLKKYGRFKIAIPNKKIAFGSGKERFPMGLRPVALTVKQLKILKENLPFERRIRDQPVMQKRPEEIKPRLSAIPKHMQMDYELSLRKRLFKFLPLPGTKVLIKEDELIHMNAGKFYDRTLDPNSFLNKDLNLKTLIDL